MNYKTCKTCGFVHYVDSKFKDRQATCYRCGGIKFSDDAPENLDPNFKIPPFCDWRLQSDIEETARNLTYELFKKNNRLDLTNASLINDIITYIILAANLSRKTFAEGQDLFSKPPRQWPNNSAARRKRKAG